MTGDPRDGVAEDIELVHVTHPSPGHETALVGDLLQRDALRARDVVCVNVVGAAERTTAAAVSAMSFACQRWRSDRHLLAGGSRHPDR